MFLTEIDGEFKFMQQVHTHAIDRNKFLSDIASYCLLELNEIKI